MREPDINDQNIHIDTYYLEAFLMSRNEGEKEAKKEVQTALRRARTNGDIFIKFSFLVIAELINNLNNKVKDGKNRKEMLKGLFDLLKNSKIDVEPPKGDSLNIAASIKNSENDLNITDVLIVAHALCDHQSSILLMNDSDVLASKVINKMKNMDGRSRPLQIRESIN